MLGVLAAPSVKADDLPDRTLTLEDSIRLATNNSQALLTSREDVNIALQRVREAEGLFFPKLDLNANWSKFRVEGNRPLMLEPALGPTLITDSPRQNYYTARANIYQTVYEGGRARNTWRQARISYERAKAANEEMDLQTRSAAKQAFFDLLLAQEKSRAYARSIQALESLANRSHRAGIADQIRYEGELAQFRSEAAEAKLEEDKSRLAYLRTLNLELNTHVALRGELVTHAVDLDLQKLLAWSTQYRAELRQTEYQQELDALGISLSLAERTPTVAFGASYERTGHELDLVTSNWAGTLNVNLPISISEIVFGFAKVRERRALYRQATLKHVETADQIQMQVREAFARYQFWQGELGPREQSFKRIDGLVTELKRAGGGPADWVVAQRQLIESRLRFHNAVHAHLTALANLERAVGHSLNSED